MNHTRRIINLELDDTDGWKQPTKDQFKDFTIVEQLCEILGSMEQSSEPNISHRITIDIDTSSIRVTHNGSPINTNDMLRLLKAYSHKIKADKKGTSKQGIGWRAVAASCANGELKDYNINEDYDYSNYSVMISKVKEDININDANINININIKKNSIITFIHDENFQIELLIDNKFYVDLYNSNMKDEAGMMFIIPNNHDINNKGKDDLIHSLKLLYNRSDCELFFNKKNIFETKRFNYVTDKIKDNRYLEVRFKLYTHKNSKVLKMSILNKKNIKNLENKDHYFKMNTPRQLNDKNIPDTYNEWVFDGDIKDCVYDDYYFDVRMMGNDPDNHKDNDDFKDWHTFYTNKGGSTGYGDGILPYIGNNCLRYILKEDRKSYCNRIGVTVKQSGRKDKKCNLSASKVLHREWTDNHKSTPYVRKIDNLHIHYKSNQNYLCELIESRNMVDKKYSIINKPSKKTDSRCSDGRGYCQKVPFFLTFIMLEYIWYRDKEEVIIQPSPTVLKKEIEILSSKNKKIEKEKNKAIKDKNIAEQTAKESKEALELAENEKNLEAIKKKKSMVRNAKLMEVLKEQVEETDELHKDLETNYIPIEEEKNVKEGYCYCLIDTTRPGWRKIGMTSKSKKQLLNQYNKGTRFFPIPLKMIHWCDYKSAKLAEKNIFEKLKKFKYEKSEWFDFKNMDKQNINSLIEEEFAKVKSFMEC